MKSIAVSTSYDDNGIGQTPIVVVRGTMNTPDTANPAHFVGAIICIFVVTSLWLLIVSRFVRANIAVFLASILSLLTASVLGGFWFANGQFEDIASIFGLYFMPQLLVLAFLYWRRKTMALRRHQVSSKASADIRQVEEDVPTSLIASPDTKSISDDIVRSNRHKNSRLHSNFVACHWRGEFSLPTAYWGINFLGHIALVAAIGMLSDLLTPDEGFEPSGIFWLDASVWLLTAVVVVWQVVGLWRSANRYSEQRRRERQAAFWAGAAQFAAAVAVIRLLLAFTQSGAPEIVELYRIAFLGDPDIPASEVTLLANGKELSVFGGIKYGLATDVEHILNDAPDVSVVHLTSGGGRLAEAKKLAQMLRQRELNTYVPKECSSACTLVFAAGRQRSLLDGAKLGYHGLSFPGLSKEERRLSNQELAKLYSEAGLEGSFIERAVAIPPDKMWYPKPDELLRAKVVTAIVTGEKFSRSGHEIGPSLAP